jgi:hypothetical protein
MRPINKTRFVRGSTQMVNVGENNPGAIVYAGESGSAMKAVWPMST